MTPEFERARACAGSSAMVPCPIDKSGDLCDNVLVWVSCRGCLFVHCPITYIAGRNASDKRTDNRPHTCPDSSVSCRWRFVLYGLAWRGWAGRGWVWLGAVGRGWERSGEVRRGAAGRGMAWVFMTTTSIRLSGQKSAPCGSPLMATVVDCATKKAPAMGWKCITDHRAMRESRTNPSKTTS